jgi:hypothetical protein
MDFLPIRSWYRVAKTGKSVNASNGRNVSLKSLLGGPVHGQMHHASHGAFAANTPQVV